MYILTNQRNTVLYTGVTNNLIRRVYEHKNKITKGFSEKYHADKLVYYEETSDVNSAISREKRIKGWLRAKKIKLIPSFNPTFKDLYDEITR